MESIARDTRLISLDWREVVAWLTLLPPRQRVGVKKDAGRCLLATYLHSRIGLDGLNLAGNPQFVVREGKVTTYSFARGMPDGQSRETSRPMHDWETALVEIFDRCPVLGPPGYFERVTAREALLMMREAIGVEAVDDVAALVRQRWEEAHPAPVAPAADRLLLTAGAP